MRHHFFNHIPLQGHNIILNGVIPFPDKLHNSITFFIIGFSNSGLEENQLEGLSFRFGFVCMLNHKTDKR